MGSIEAPLDSGGIDPMSSTCSAGPAKNEVCSEIIDARTWKPEIDGSSIYTRVVSTSPTVSAGTPQEDALNSGDSKQEGLQKAILGGMTNTFGRNDRSNDSKSSSDIIFIDPLGTRWTFPYAICRTWQEVKELLKEVFIDCYLPKWCSDELDAEPRASDDFALIVLKPHRSHILPSHWEHLVVPGLEFTIQFRLNYSLLREVNIARTKQPGTLQGAEDKQEKKESKETKPVLGSEGQVTRDEQMTDIIYSVTMLRMNASQEVVVTANKSSVHEPVIEEEDEKLGSKKSVLEEKREVFRSALALMTGRFETGDPILYIHSAALLAALRTIIEFRVPAEEYTPVEPGADKILTNLDTGVFVYPFADLYHYKDRLLAYKTADPSSPYAAVRRRHNPEFNALCDKHIDILVRYLYAQASIGLKAVEELWRHSVPKTTFKSLWLLFPPGSEVYVQDKGGKLNAYIVEAFEAARSSELGIFGEGQHRTFARPCEVRVWNLTFDGRHLTRSLRTIYIPVFDGERDIRTLPVHPVRFADDPTGTLYRNLVTRGQRYVRIMKKPTLQEFTGPSTLQGIRSFNRARVVVDHTCRPWTDIKRSDHTSNHHIPANRRLVTEEAYGLNELVLKLGERTRHPRCPCKTCESTSLGQTGIPLRTTFDDYDDIDLNADKPVTEHQLFLCHSHAYAFVLRDRLWDLLDVSLLEDPIHNKNVIDTLVMKPESNKQMIRAVCEVFGGSYPQLPFTADFIAGKGEGQIILLHGPPGTGKTLTAESVAEYTGRPLLSITAADLGHEPEVLETKLLNFFRDANRWNAIVLLDEADVYLETRSQSDLRRNSIVSIFLRVLDYFQGILFLTTNRVGRFDEAFMSRIHVQIGYDPLDDAARERIWENHFRKLEDNHRSGGPEILCSYAAQECVRVSQELKDLKWNGREIRNAFQTAVALACFEAKERQDPVPKLTDRHIRQVVQMSRNFKAYMHATRGRNNESQVAFLDGLRDDRHPAAGAGEV